MRLLTILTASVLLSASALPAFAIDAKDAPAIYDAADLSDNADIALWCGAAYALAVSQGMVTGDDATGYTTQSQAMLTNAATLMVTEEGMTADEAKDLAEAYTYHVADQIVTGSGDDADYTQEECATEAAK